MLSTIWWHLEYELILSLQTRIWMASSVMSKKPLTPRKLPVQKRSAATVAAILEAATQVLEHQGIAGFTTNEIARRAGVSIGTMYQYYPDKQAIAAMLSRAVRTTLIDRITKAVEAARFLSLREGLRLLTAAALQSDATRPKFARALDALELHLGLNDEEMMIHQIFVQEIARFLQMKRPEYPSSELTNLADDIIVMAGALGDAELRRQGSLNDAVIERIVSLALELIRNHLGAPDSE